MKNYTIVLFIVLFTMTMIPGVAQPATNFATKYKAELIENQCKTFNALVSAWCHHSTTNATYTKLIMSLLQAQLRLKAFVPDSDTFKFMEKIVLHSKKTPPQKIASEICCKALLEKHPAFRVRCIWKSRYTVYRTRNR